jgi:hypothetical protein
MPNSFTLQKELRPVLPVIRGCKDYTEQQRLLERVDRILRASGLEDLFVELHLQNFLQQSDKRTRPVGLKEHKRQAQESIQALRCTLLKNFLHCGYRELSKRLAECALYRWFCALAEFPEVQVPSKSRLHDYAHWLVAAQMELILSALTKALVNEARALQIGLENELDTAGVFVDSTCVKANMHFPVDWVLLRDGVRTLIKSIIVIRRHGLRDRISEPETFISRVNALTMRMSQAGRNRKTCKKARKQVLREMKRLCVVVEKHARRYRDTLDEHWQETDLSRAEAEVILTRMNNVITQLPEARRQAHERIIGERAVPSGQKILSLYENDVHVVVRGKAGADVEFGNSLFVAETREGFILDHELLKEQSGGDAKWLRGRLKELTELSGGRLLEVTADRGFESAALKRELLAAGIECHVCPKSPAELERRSEEESFRNNLRRRAQTEGRIAILKNVFLGGIPKAKGYERRRVTVAWAVLAHNLWWVARKKWKESEYALLQAA